MNSSDLGDAPRPIVSLAPGLRLRTEVGVALHELAQSADVRTVRDNLRGALAYTAAIGETAMISAAAECVRLSVSRLDAGLVSPACTALTEALRLLSPAPAQHRDAVPVLAPVL
ncbi:hypothetical protein [Kibdelosporangium phytohabitans]|uniref:Uncharacterized protein n=1 Tax=Kibdelosporangium phytohabitans TaxID=860235 RepID=A0A0N9HP91_9PSEU|nr:hypothetical protein [Kibdelosporangium phytohabitans]ALG08817.1 hypothetical protein AOZ06_19550 [Kibdelosporangium phytohabitans]MBE1470041.1 hypothetical protein [Kibdelosporangium phytohabitans]